MTMKSALMVVFGLILALTGSCTAVNPPFGSGVQNDAANDATKLIAGIVAIAGMVMFAVGALSKTRKD